jgi:hypothetical protein
VLLVVGPVVAVAHVAWAVIAAVTNMSAWVVAALALVVQAVAGLADVPGRIIGALPGLSGGRNRRGG